MSSSNSGGGMGIGGVLTVVFIVLKCVGTIDWSWWWVFSPIWLTFVVVLGVLLLAELVKALP